MIMIVDENITLELTAEKHAAPLLYLVDKNRKHLSEFLPWVENMQTENDFINYIKNCQLLFQQQSEVSFVIIFNGNVVGRIGLHYLNLQNKIGAIGYWLAENAMGKGIIIKSCKALINYGFSTLNLNRIEIKAAVNNFKSQAIPIKLNFEREGILRQAEFVNNEFIDLFLFSMLKKDWTQ